MENYYSNEMNEKYMSYSQFKDFMQCPAMAMAKINGDWKDKETDSLLVGSYVDAWLDNNIYDFKESHPQIFNSKNGELKAPYKHADLLCLTISKDKYLYNLLAGGERQKVLFCNIAGVPFKCKLDCLHKDFIVDGKVLKDCKDVWVDGEYKSFIYANRYDYQGYIYKTAVKQNIGKDLPFLLGVVTKEDVPDKRIFKLTDTVLNNAGDIIINNAPKFYRMKLGKEPVYGCGKCNYCKSIKMLNRSMIEEV